MVVLLIFVIGALILLTFGYSLANQLKEDTDIETCRLSVLAQAELRKVPVIGISSPKTIVPLDCPRRKIKIFEDKVEIDKKKLKRYKFNQLNREDVNRILAEELRLCWYKMAEGTKDVFEYDWLVSLKNVCLICAEIEFDKELNEQSFDGLLDYLKSNNLPKSDITYFNYLIRNQRDRYLGYLPWSQYWTPWSWGTTNEIDKGSISTIEKYYIYFLAYKPDFFNTNIKAYTQAYYIGLGNGNKLTGECNEQVN